MRGQRILAVRRTWLLEKLRAISPEMIPDDAEVTDLQYLPLTQDILLTISSGTFRDPPGFLQTQAQFY